MLKEIITLSETELINRIIEGEKSLYEILVNRYNSYLYKIGRSYNYNHDDTEDLMQDTYIDAFKNLRQFEVRSSFKTWISRIMLNNCYRKKEKKSFQNELSGKEIREGVIPLFGNNGNDVNREINNKELREIIETSLGEIGEEYRMVFSLREINGFSVAETADLLNISESNVKVRLNRAKTMLRNYIETHHDVPELFEYNLMYCQPFTEKLMKNVDTIEINH